MRIVITTIVLFAGLIGGACASPNPLNGNADPTPIPTQTNGNPSPSPIPASEDPLVIAELERFAAMASIKNLKDKKLGEREAELRVWVGFGPAITRGLILTNDDGLYSGVYIPPAGENARSIKPRSVEAQHGLESLWQTLEKNGFFDLGDDSSVEPFPDSTVVFAEFKKGSAHRRYSFSAPCYSTTREAKILLSSLESINASLGFVFYGCSNPS